MPPSNDPEIVELSTKLLKQFKFEFGSHPGFRPNHPRGVLVTGTFVPSLSAPTLTRASHFNPSSDPVAVTARFSSATGCPAVGDNELGANPRSISLRFHLPSIDGLRRHTDIIAHGFEGFATRTGDEFLEFREAAVASKLPDASVPNPLELFFKKYPATERFVKAKKPSPTSFARELYYGVHAYKFTDKDGNARFARYRFSPDAGVEHLDDATTKDPSYLYDELKTRIGQGRSISFRLSAQLAEEGDTLDDATVAWPTNRELLDLGKVTLNSFVENDAAEQKYIIYDVIPRVDGIDPSDDPQLELRAHLYYTSGLERRAAEVTEPKPCK
jgi:catalase